MFTDCVPFKEFIVHPDKNVQLMKPAGYINKIKQQPDWEIIFKNENLPDWINHQGELSDYSLLNEFEQIRLNSHWKAQLDETQLAAIELALRKKLALIQVRLQVLNFIFYIEAIIYLHNYTFSLSTRHG